MSVSIEVDGHAYSVEPTDKFAYRLADEGQPMTIEFRVTGGLVPNGCIEYVRIGFEDDGIVFVMDQGGKCTPYAGQKSETLASIAARYVHNRFASL
jgi:hypothetical protein